MRKKAEKGKEEKQKYHMSALVAYWHSKATTKRKTTNCRHINGKGYERRHHVWRMLVHGVQRPAWLWKAGESVWTGSPRTDWPTCCVPALCAMCAGNGRNSTAGKSCLIHETDTYQHILYSRQITTVQGKARQNARRYQQVTSKGWIGWDATEHQSFRH